MELQSLNLGELFFFAIIFIATIFFAWTLFQFLAKIPPENQAFPKWFVWLFLVPVVGYIFKWIMLPFGIPTALKKTYSTNQDAINAAEFLFKLGLIEVICVLLSIFLPLYLLKLILALVGYAAWITYWVKIVEFKKKYIV